MGLSQRGAPLVGLPVGRVHVGHVKVQVNVD